MFNPRWMYHATLPPVVVNTQEELDALPEGFANSPGEAAGAVVDTVQRENEIREAEVTRLANEEMIARQVAEAEAQQRANVARVHEEEQAQAKLVEDLAAGRVVANADGVLVNTVPAE